ICARTWFEAVVGSMNPPLDNAPKTPVPQVTPSTTRASPAARTAHRARTTKCPQRSNMAPPTRTSSTFFEAEVQAFLRQLLYGGPELTAEEARPEVREAPN